VGIASERIRRATAASIAGGSERADERTSDLILKKTLPLRAPVDAFFEDVMVNAEALDLRLNRLGLLKSLHVAMNRVADLSKLA